MHGFYPPLSDKSSEFVRLDHFFRGGYADSVDSPIREPKRRKPDAERRKEHIDVRVTQLQKDAITRAAKKRALDPSTWLRSIGLEQTDWEPDQDAEFLAQQKKK